MNKQQFLNVVSKIDTTGEDEFHAEFNSPELLWDKFLIHCFEQLQKHGVVQPASESAAGGELLQAPTKYGQRGGICLCEIAIMFPDKDLKCECDGNLMH